MRFFWESRWLLRSIRCLPNSWNTESRLNAYAVKGSSKNLLKMSVVSLRWPGFLLIRISGGVSTISKPRCLECEFGASSSSFGWHCSTKSRPTRPIRNLKLNLLACKHWIVTNPHFEDHLACSIHTLSFSSHECRVVLQWKHFVASDLYVGLCWCSSGAAEV